MAKGKIKYSDLFDADLLSRIAALNAEIETLCKSAAEIKKSVPKTDRLIELLIREVKESWESEGINFALKPDESDELDELIKKYEEAK